MTTFSDELKVPTKTFHHKESTRSEEVHQNCPPKRVINPLSRSIFTTVDLLVMGNRRKNLCNYYYRMTSYLYRNISHKTSTGL